MCGLAGIVRLDGRAADRVSLERMSAAIRHRGPDGDGLVLEGPVGLGHRRLSIIDLATGQQPMMSGELTLVFNGEIYNCATPCAPVATRLKRPRIPKSSSARTTSGATRACAS